MTRAAHVELAARVSRMVPRMYEAFGTWVPYFAFGALAGTFLGGGIALARKTMTLLPVAVVALASVLSVVVIAGVETATGATSMEDRVILSIATTTGAVVGAFLGAFPIVYVRWVLRTFAGANRRATTVVSQQSRS